MDTNNKNKNQDVPKKCFCARCFLPIDESEKVEIDGQNFHKMCGTCCICRTIPAKLKMFYGHVFCEECFKTFVLARFRGENPQVHTDTWWMQFAPGVKAQEKSGEDAKPKPDAKPAPPTGNCDHSSPGPEAKRCICARCLQAVDDKDKVEIAGQTFHCNCAKCCSCHQVPKDNIKIYCGQVFCEECFHRHILSRSRDNPAEFFKNCFEQWQGNPQFLENMKVFMESGARAQAPLVFVAPPPPPAFSAHEARWQQSAESKSASPAAGLASGPREPEAHRNTLGPASSRPAGAAEKIEKLTKYLRETSSFNTETPKKWKTIEDTSRAPIVDEADRAKWQRRPISIMSKLSCPKCLWQSGTIYVNRD